MDSGRNCSFRRWYCFAWPGIAVDTRGDPYALPFRSGSVLWPLEEVSLLNRCLEHSLNSFDSSCLRSNNAQASASAKTNGRSAKPARASSEPESDDEGSVDLNVSNSNVCGACRTTESKKWWKAPKGLTSNCLCNTCGPNWRKYADLNVRAIRDDSLIGGPKSKSDKREASPLFGPTAKRTKVSTRHRGFKGLCLTNSQLSGTSPTPSSQLRCLACHKNGPIGKVLKCSQCQVRVHAGMFMS